MKTTRGMFKLPWLSLEQAMAEAERTSLNFGMRFRAACTMVVKGEGGYLTLQGDHRVGTRINWDEEELVVVSKYHMGVKFDG